MRSRRVGDAFRHGPAVAATAASIPGLHVPEPRTARATFVSATLAVLLHAGLLGALLAAVWLKPDVVEELIPVRVLQEPKLQEPAPRPRAIAERRAVRFNPEAAAVTPKVVDPRIVPQSVRAEAARVSEVAPVEAPTDVTQTDVAARTITAVRAESEVAQSVIEAPSAGALRKIDMAPIGTSVGPRQIASRGRSAGSVEGAVRGTTVREGIRSSRDVQGSPSGSRVADVDTRVGEGLLAGRGGSGLGVGGDDEECMERPEVQQYWSQMHDRVLSRWHIPPGTPPNQTVSLRFKLDPGGSATFVELDSEREAKLGESAVEAFRAATPFPPMSDRVRCLARTAIRATFRNPL